jgi:hypothetical protein
VALTADHGMNDKSNADGSPKVIWLQDLLDARFGTGKSIVICPITDRFVAHHGALGYFPRVEFRRNASRTPRPFQPLRHYRLLSPPGPCLLGPCGEEEEEPETDHYRTAVTHGAPPHAEYVANRPTTWEQPYWSTSDTVNPIMPLLGVTSPITTPRHCKDRISLTRSSARY